MTHAQNISVMQLLGTLFVCRLPALFMFLPADGGTFSPGDRMAAFLPFTVLGILCCLPALAVAGRREDRTLFTLTGALPSAAEIAAGVLYAAYAVWNAALGAARLDLFMGTVMYNGADVTWLVFLLLAGTVFVACRGLQTVARTGAAVLAMTAVSLVYVGVTTLGLFDVTNLSPPLQDGAWELIKNSYSAVSRTGEIAALLLLAPRSRGRLKRACAVWMGAFGLTASMLFTLITGVTGTFGERQTFRLYALTVLSKVGVVERVDSLICAVWVLCTLVRNAFWLYAAARFAARGREPEHGTAVICGLAAAVFAVYLGLSRSETAFTAVLASGADEILFFALIVLLPTGLYLTGRIGTKQRRRKRAYIP